MKPGDNAGLLLLQRNYGWVGVRNIDGKKTVVLVTTQSGTIKVDELPDTQHIIFLKAHCDFKDRNDKAYFSYSLDGETWKPIGTAMQMTYTLPHFMGYRFGLFNYATEQTGGFVDFDYFKIDNK